MTQPFHFLDRCVGALVVAAAITTSAVARAGPVVYVTNVEQLYDALNNQPNEGAAVVLAPGIYLLSANDPAGKLRAHGGRLELQRDMSLYGVAGDRAAVVIDAADTTRMPSGSFTTGVSFGRSGVVRIGNGTNTVEWLTIHGNAAAAASIATELTSTSTTIRVAHVFSDGSSRGVDVRNVLRPPMDPPRRIDAEVIDNEFEGPPVLLPNTMSEGIRLANFAGADGGVIDARLSGNVAHGFQIGCIVANNQSSNGDIRVRSSGDRFFSNNLGCLIAGGLSQSTRVANSNSTVFEAFGSEFFDNIAQIGGSQVIQDGIRGGIRVVGGLATTSPNVVSDNTVSVSLTGSKVFGNQVVDFEAFGALKTPPTSLAGINNHVTITLRGVSRQIDVIAVDSLPVDPFGSNTVTVLPSPAP